MIFIAVASDLVGVGADPIKLQDVNVVVDRVVKDKTLLI